MHRERFEGGVPPGWAVYFYSALPLESRSYVFPYQSSRSCYRLVNRLTTPATYSCRPTKPYPCVPVSVGSSLEHPGRADPDPLARKRSHGSETEQPCRHRPSGNHYPNGMHSIALNRQLGVGFADTHPLPIHRGRVCTRMESALAH